MFYKDKMKELCVRCGNISLLFFLVKALSPLAERNTLGSTFPLHLHTRVIFVQRVLGPQLNVSDKGIDY